MNNLSSPPLAVLRARTQSGDWSAQAVVVPDGNQARFIPGTLPCGECGACRRAVVSSCVAPRRWLMDAGAEVPSDLPQRFTYVFDPTQVAPRAATWADVVAPLLEAMGRCGLGPGDTSLWIGTSPLALVAATLASSRGSNAILVGPPHLQEGLAALSSGDSEGLPRFAGWKELDATTLRLSEESPGGFVERHVFVMSDDAIAWSAAVHLLAPGTTLIGFGGVPAIAGLPADARVFTLGMTYNPDFVPEALAALGNNPALAAACNQLGQHGAYDIWPNMVEA